ncbi:hypothetical protein RZS08_63850, partial [Arthrospira platensis SPKY1]|nr:hypothetical protein [Arthrospira platensis SPKY1]
MLLPQFELLQQWCEEARIHWTAPQFMVHNHKVADFLKAQVAIVNEHLPAYKRIGNIHLLHEAWTAEAGELTPT